MNSTDARLAERTDVPHNTTTVGAAAAIGYLDFVLFPALAFFIAITGDALWRRKRMG